jgi:hypothetical protein
MIETALVFLALLQIKHWYIDFVNQSNIEIASKGIYGDFHGIMHSVKHGGGTVLCAWLTFGWSYMFFCWVLGIIDFFIHYHIDWAKMNINRNKGYTIEMPQFWAWLGADQMAHQLTYIGLVWLAVA